MTSWLNYYFDVAFLMSCGKKAICFFLGKVYSFSKTSWWCWRASLYSQVCLAVNSIGDKLSGTGLP